MPNKKKNIIEFQQKKVTRKDKKENVVDQGNLGDLKYKVFKRGVIHITDKKGSLTFKKDCELFEEAIDKLDISSLKEVS